MIDVKLDLDGTGKPRLRIKHHDRSDDLEQKLLGVLIKAMEDKGVTLQCSGGLVECGTNNSWKSYTISAKDTEKERVCSTRYSGPDRMCHEKTAPTEVDTEQHMKVLRILSRNAGERLRYSEIMPKIKAAVSDIIEPIGDNKTREYFHYYMAEGLIQKIGKDRDPNTHYRVEI